MTVTVAKGRASGSITAPPSKSMAHRLLLCAGLCCDGESLLSGFDRHSSADILATVDCLNALGAKCRWESAHTVACVSGICREQIPPRPVLHCGESGSTLRFFLPLCMAIGKACTLIGSNRLLQRPLAAYEAIAKAQQIRWQKAVDRVTVCGSLTGGDFYLPGNISSQFISGLLFVLPTLLMDSTLHLVAPVESRPYIDMTLDALAAFGVQAAFINKNTISCPGGQSYRAGNHTVSGDWSNAAFFFALSALGGDVTVSGLDDHDMQGDRAIGAHLASLKDGQPTIDLSDTPDLAPILFAVAGAMNGADFTGTQRLRLKESDRIDAMAQELLKFGISLTAAPDASHVKIRRSGALHAPKDALFGHNDHRIVMALSVLLTLTGGSIHGAEAVEKSMPDFFDQLARLQIQITKQ